MITRIISAIVMAVLVAAAILWAPAGVFNALLIAAVVGGLYEFARLSLPPDQVYRETMMVYGFAVAVSLLFKMNANFMLWVIIIGLFIVTLIYMHHATTFEGVTEKIGITLLGAIYLGATLPFFGIMRTLTNGKTLVFMAITAAAMSDSFALFVGRAIGRRKFAPLTSPNKTWEGFLGGLFGSVLSIYFIKLIAWQTLPLVHVVAIGLMIGFVGPMGDLIESLFKRDYHVKDSGHLIPGHGGILDRLDALVFTGPFLYLYAKWLLI